MGKRNDYDAIIIGAGISGLVCGCYLAKAGLKTLIVEKNAKPGGYCMSFTRKGFHFDACVHALSSLRKEGRLRKLLKDLDLLDKIKFVRHDPSNVIITPKFKINVFNDYHEAAKEFQKYFPDDKKNIQKFFKYVVSTPVDNLFKLRGITLEQMLNDYFTNKDLKMILATMIWGLVGTFPNKISALVSALVFREFIFDGGYYPIGGIQSLPDILLRRFSELNGEYIFSQEAKKIDIRGNKATGVVLGNGKHISASAIVSASDTRQTFLNLIGKKKIRQSDSNTLKSLTHSSSAYLVYIGLKKTIKTRLDLKSNIWVINSDSQDAQVKDFSNLENDFFVITSPCAKEGSLDEQKPGLCLTTIVTHKDESYWDGKDKKQMSEKLVNMAKEIIPDLNKNIAIKVIATPATLYRWTRNYKGSAYGWASTPSQFGNPDISQKTKFKNLYLTGHWTNLSSGITSVVNSSQYVSYLILQERKIKL